MHGKRLIISILFVFAAAFLSTVVIPKTALRSTTVFDTVSLVSSIIMLLVSWKLILITSNGKNILQDYFIVVMMAALWLLILDGLAIIWEMLDIVPRVFRLGVARGLLVFGMLQLAMRVKLLAQQDVQARRTDFD